MGDLQAVLDKSSSSCQQSVEVLMVTFFPLLWVSVILLISFMLFKCFFSLIPMVCHTKSSTNQSYFKIWVGSRVLLWQLAFPFYDFIKKFSWTVLICQLIFQVKGNHLKNVKYMHSQVCWTQSITTSGSLFQKSDRKKLLWRAGRHQYIFSHLKWKWRKEAFTLTSTDCKNHFQHCCNNPRCQFWLQWQYLLLHWCTGIL